MEPIGWHFCAIESGKPILRDGTVLEIGKTYEHRGKVVLCSSGYHDSIRALDALRYAPGPYVCRVRVEETVNDKDKRVSRYRTAVSGFDATSALQQFAVFAAEQVIDIFENKYPNDNRPRLAIEAAKNYISGNISREELKSAANAANAAYAAANAADANAYAAAYYAANAATYAAANAAAYAANAAAYAAYAAANAARDTLQTILNNELERLLTDALPKASNYYYIAKKD